MDIEPMANKVATVVTLIGAVIFCYRQSGVLWRFSARKRAEWHERQYREMSRRMRGHAGEMIAYAAQRVTVASMGLLLVFVAQFLTANDPPIIILAGNLAGLLTAGFLIIYTGDELLRLSDFEKWKADRIAAIRKNLERSGLTGKELEATLELLITADTLPIEPQKGDPI